MEFFKFSQYISLYFPLSMLYILYFPLSVLCILARTGFCPFHVPHLCVLTVVVEHNLIWENTVLFIHPLL